MLSKSASITSSKQTVNSGIRKSLESMTSKEFAVWNSRKVEMQLCKANRKKIMEIVKIVIFWALSMRSATDVDLRKYSYIVLLQCEDFSKMYMYMRNEYFTRVGGQTLYTEDIY